MNDPDWPDFLDVAQGTFIYFGDNKRPGNGLEATPRGGNRLLRYCFERVHASQRSQVPPFFVFTKGSAWRDVVFRGIAVPSVEGLPRGRLDRGLEICGWRTVSELSSHVHGARCAMCIARMDQ